MNQSIKTDVVPDESLWRRLRHTPLRDALRLRLTGRLDLRRLVATSRLPMPLQALTLEVVRRTGLWRLEKVDVARELVAHFQDGLAGGATLEQLAGSFGEPRMVAKLIRKAKKRQRPLWWRAMRRAIQGAGLLLLILLLSYLILAIRFFTARPGPVHDYLPQINAAALSAMPDERAWPLYREALLAMPELRGEQAITMWSQRPGDQDWPAAERFLLAHQPELQRIRSAALRPMLGYVVGHTVASEDMELWGHMQRSESGGLISLLLPYLGEVRQLAMILALDAHLAAAAGDSAQALDDVIAIMGLARQCRQPPTVISGLVSIAILQVVYDTAGQLLAEQPPLFSDDQLQDLAHRLAGLRDEDIRVDLSTQRQSFIDVAQRVYSDDGEGDGHLTREGLRHLSDFVLWPDGLDVDMSWRAQDLLGPTLLVVVADRRDMLHMHGRIMADLEAAALRPLWQQHVEAIDAQVEALNSNLMTRMRYFPITLLMPALGRPIQASEAAMSGRDALQVAIALELFRRRHGDWPARLQELMPALLPTIPMDRFDGAPMRYVLREGRPVLYSIGCNHRDDRGALGDRFSEPVENNNAARRWCEPQDAARYRSGEWPSNWFVEGDWILWPPVVSRE